jgi:hypothetical protein
LVAVITSSSPIFLGLPFKLFNMNQLQHRYLVVIAAEIKYVRTGHTLHLLLPHAVRYCWTDCRVAPAGTV